METRRKRIVISLMQGDKELDSISANLPWISPIAMDEVEMLLNSLFLLITRNNIPNSVEKITLTTENANAESQS